MIRFLDSHLINQISAGEVVERPASVLKELIENALDAQATHITIRWRQGGHSILEVEDDGVGIAPEEMRLALSRHATSKLSTQEDLSAIATFGFRGEALAAMASVARIVLTSRVRHHEHAWSLSVHGGQEVEFLPAHRPCGTSVQVRDLFFATPARLKFLRSVSIEQTYLWDVIHKLMLSHPEVSFSVHSDIRSMDYPVGMEKRLKHVFGSSFLQNSFYVNEQRDTYSLEGWIGLPTHHRSAADRQFYCVNARSVKDKVLASTLRLAFGDTVPKGRHPVGALFLTLPLSDVDVNVHPAKTEVRFLDERFIRGFVTGILKQEIWKNGLRASTWQGSSRGDGESSAPEASHSAMASHITPKTHQTPPYVSPFVSPIYDPTIAREDPYFIPKSTKPSGADCDPGLSSTQGSTPPCVKEAFPPATASDSPSILFPTPSLPHAERIFVDLGVAIMQIQNGYIVARSDAGLVLVDPHGAHERIVFESMKAEWADAVGHSLTFLLPPHWTVTPTEHDHMEMIQERMGTLGFQYYMTHEECHLTAIPMIFQGYDPEPLVRTLSAGVQQGDSVQDTVLRWRNDMMANWACRQSIKLGQPMSIEAMNILLRRLENTPHGAQCNHGRCVYRILGPKDLARLFDR